MASANQPPSRGRRRTPDQVRGDGRGGRRRPPVRRSAEHGFTLVELMVVIVIIGLLATIVAINVLPSGDKARVTAARADISTIESALDLYKLQNGSYPTTQQGLQALVTAPAGANAASYQPGGYLKGSKLKADPWGRPYLYASPGPHGEADVWSLGRDGKDGGEGTDADIGSWQ
ncbi:MAG: type II secretion system major pseudopilin GspG [Janthinobacterium lividum]